VLLDGTPPNAPNDIRDLITFRRGALLEPPSGWEGLCHAVESGPLRPLLNTWSARGGGIPLLSTFIETERLDIVQAALRAGADPNLAKTPDAPEGAEGESPTRLCTPQQLELLLEAGADVRLPQHQHALYNMVSRRATVLVEALLARGADPLVVGLSAYDAARENCTRPDAGDVEREIFEIVARAARTCVLSRPEAPSVRWMRPARKRGFERLLRDRLDAGIGFGLVASRGKLDVVAEAVCATFGGRRVEAQVADRRVMGGDGLFVLQLRGSEWVLALTAPAVRRIGSDLPRHRAVASDLFARTGTEAWLATSVGIFVVGAEERRILVRAEDDPRSQTMSSRRFDHRDEEMAATAIEAMRQAGLAIPFFRERSNGLELVMEVEGTRSSLEQATIVVLSE
jgi:hypothetical protein